MRIRSSLLLVLALAFAGAAQAQQYPLVDMVANRVIEKYQSMTCEQMWEQRGQPKSMEEQNLIQVLRENPQAQEAFFNKISAPIVNKMFQCGLIP